MTWMDENRVFWIRAFQIEDKGEKRPKLEEDLVTLKMLFYFHVRVIDWEQIMQDPAENIKAFELNPEKDRKLLEDFVQISDLF